MQSTLRRWWWWIPLALLGALFLKAWFVAGMVQGTARELAADAAGIPIDNVEIRDGLDVRLTGFADGAARDRAVAAVDELDSSWDVEGVVAETAAPTAVDPDPQPDDEPISAPSAESAAVTIDVAAGGAVVLEGVVANQAVRAGLVDQAVATFGRDNVTDDLTLDPEAVAAEGGSLTVTGLASSDAQRSEWISGAELIAAAGGLDLTDDVEVEPEAKAAEPSVTQQLNALFELEPIEFDTSRATIRSTSESTLDAAAEVINENPEAGRLIVVGHTDSDGGDGFNLDLSQRRAGAVVDYLVNNRDVDADRLQAQGRGETELKIEPDSTPEDKQRNRRIEWELTE